MTGRAHNDRDAGRVRLFRLLLLLYPRAFRLAYEREMLQIFRDRVRDDRPDSSFARRQRFWLHTVIDIARSAPAERLEDVMTPFMLQRLTGLVLVLGAAVVALYTFVLGGSSSDTPAGLELSVAVLLSGGLIGMYLMYGSHLVATGIGVVQTLLVVLGVVVGGWGWYGGVWFVLVLATFGLGVALALTRSELRWLGVLLLAAGVLQFTANPSNSQLWLGLPLALVWATIGYLVWSGFEQRRAMLS